MAKRTVVGVEGGALGFTFAMLSVPLRTKIVGMRRAVGILAKDLGVARERVAETAPKLLALFSNVQAEAGERKVSVAEFARLFDDSIPMHANDNNEGAGYKNHPVYYAVTYAIRVQQQKNRPRTSAGQGVFDGSKAKLERVIAMILSIVKDKEDFWIKFGGEFKMIPRTLKTLQNRVSKVEPLLDLTSLVKPFNISAAKVIPMGETVEALRKTKASVTAGLDALHAKGKTAARRTGTAG